MLFMMAVDYQLYDRQSKCELEQLQTKLLEHLGLSKATFPKLRHQRELFGRLSLRKLLGRRCQHCKHSLN